MSDEWVAKLCRVSVEAYKEALRELDGVQGIEFDSEGFMYSSILLEQKRVREQTRVRLLRFRQAHGIGQG